MSILSTLLNTPTTEATSQTQGLWGRTEASDSWVTLDAAEWLAGRIGRFELQMDLNTGSILVVEDGEVAEEIPMDSFKPINKVTRKGDRVYYTLFSFRLENKEVTTFLNTAKDGRQYFGLAFATPAKASTHKRLTS